MKRFLFRSWMGVLTLVGCLASAKETTKGRPNIVMIISDDQAWTDYSFMGHPHIQTPNLDRLAKQSLFFPRGYVPSSLCCPSLASIVTGLYPHQHKVTSNDPPQPMGMTPAQFRQQPAFQSEREVMTRHLEAMPTLPRMLAQQGYESFQSGKWWQGNFARGGFTHGMTHGERHGDEGLDIGRKTMQPVYDFIATTRAAGKPFFVWYAPMMPHLPHNPPERLLKKYHDVTPSLQVAKYWASIEWFDETVGELLTYLDKNGLAENTVVTFVADNGWIQDPQNQEYAPKSKQSQYDGGLRTPILIRWPGKVKPHESQGFAMSIDFMPTLLKAAGVRPPRGLPGIDLLDEKATAKRKAIYGECFTHTAVDLEKPAASLRFRWVIEGDWKLIVPVKQNEPNGVVELYDLARDPKEETNLATTQPAEVKRLQKKLDRWWDGKK